MRLVRFAINDFRSVTGGLDNNSINFEDSNSIFIFGQNNVGKSSFLHAYKAFYEDTVKSDDFRFDSNKDIVMEIWLKIDEANDGELIDKGTGNKFSNLKEKYLDSNKILRLRKTWEFKDMGKTKNQKTFNVKDSKWESVSYGGVGLHRVFQPLMMKPLFIEAMPTEDQVKTIVNQILREAASKKLSNNESTELKDAVKVITNLQDKVYSKSAIGNYKKKVNDHFKSLFPNYSINIDEGSSRVKYTHDKLGKDFNVDFKKINSNQQTSYEQMGTGAVRMAIFLLMLMHDELKEEELAEKDFLVLFEEPELFLHPSLTKKLRNLVYEVSGENMPFQILCASHSPQMIDISKDHASLVRMIKDDDSQTFLFQITKDDLKNSEQTTDAQVKQKIYEILRFDPFVCESFYADEVVLVEGDTEAIIWRGYQQDFECGNQDIFVVNCHSCTNIPFYQKIFSKFNIKYSVICDTDHVDKTSGGGNLTGWNNTTEDPKFTSGIQKSIAEQFYIDKKDGKANKFLVFPDTFEPCHIAIDEPFKFDDSGHEGKPFKADRYWKKLIQNKGNSKFGDVPIINYIRAIIS